MAAELILLADEPLKFETVEIPENVHSGYLITVPDFDKNTVIFIIDIQKTAITILQERNLTIDGRLFMLGMYLDKLNESAFNGVMTSYEFEQMNQTYKDTNFLQEQAAQFSAVIKFNAHNYTRIMSELLNLILSKQTERNIFDAITKTLNLSADLERKKFIGKFSTIFENYLVNELLFNLYPFRFEGNINLSYGVFVMTYKILELITFSMAMGNDFSEKNLVNQIIDYANKIDHGGVYFEKISDYMKDKDDIVEIMQNMLQV